jgi:hypothetical protein
MKNFFTFIYDQRWRIAGGAGAAALLLALLWFRLGSLTYGKAADLEAATASTADKGWVGLFQDPLNLPYGLVQQFVALTGHHGITSLRLISTVFAILAAVLFFLVAKQWHNTRVALLGTWLFITSAWFLHVGRLGSAEILWLVSTLAVVVLLTPSRGSRHTPLALPTTLLALAAVLYVPGMVWLVLAGLIVRRKNIAEAWSATKAGWLRVLSIVLCLLALAPLIFGFARNTQLIKQWVGFGSTLPSLHDIGSNLLNVPLSLFAYSSFDPVHWLGRLPIFSVFEIVMLIVGMTFYARHFRAARTRLIAVLAVIGLALVGIMGIDAISLVLPVFYLLIASGIAYILHLWLKVFPNNPLARTIGIVVVSLAILLTSVYQTRSYFVAWRYNPETKQVFSNKLD